MSQAYNYYTGDGVTVAFEFTQPMTTKATVTGYVNLVQTSGTWDSVTGFFTFDVAPASGADVHVVRKTAYDAMVFTFPNKSYIPVGSLDTNWAQTRHMMEEQAWGLANIQAYTGALFKQAAHDWAIYPEDSLVPAASGGNEVDDYSSLHHAAKSSASAAAALASQNAAATSETNAAASASAAATSESNAATSESNAATSASNAATSASNAATSETNAAASAATAQAAAIAMALALGG